MISSKTMLLFVLAVSAVSTSLMAYRWHAAESHFLDAQAQHYRIANLVDSLFPRGIAVNASEVDPVAAIERAVTEAGAQRSSLLSVTAGPDGTRVVQMAGISLPMLAAWYSHLASERNPLMAVTASLRPSASLRGETVFEATITLRPVP